MTPIAGRRGPILAFARMGPHRPAKKSEFWVHAVIVTVYSSMWPPFRPCWTRASSSPGGQKLMRIEAIESSEDFEFGYVCLIV